MAKNTELDFKIMLRVHLTPENVNDIFVLNEKIKGTFGGDKRFYIFYKAIENLGGPKAGTFTTLCGKDKHEIIKNLYADIGETLSGPVDTNQYICYAAQTNSFVVRANGKIGKCTVAFSDDRNSLGELNDDGTLTLASDKLHLWTRGIKSQISSELSCPMYQLPKLNKRLKSIPISIQ